MKCTDMHEMVMHDNGGHASRKVTDSYGKTLVASVRPRWSQSGRTHPAHEYVQPHLKQKDRVH